MSCREANERLKNALKPSLQGREIHPMHAKMDDGIAAGKAMYNRVFKKR